MLSARTIDQALDYLTIRCLGPELGHCIDARRWARELASLRGKAMRAHRDGTKKAAQARQDVEYAYNDLARLVRACPAALGRLDVDVTIRRVESPHGRRGTPCFLRRCSLDGLWHCQCQHYRQRGWCEHATGLNAVYHLTDQRGLMMSGPLRFRPSEDHSRWCRQNARRVTNYEVEDPFPEAVRALEGMAAIRRQGF